jgi:hypothetical protein
LVYNDYGGVDMKNKLKYIFVLIFLMIIPINSVQAEDIDYFTITSTSNNNYIFNIKVGNSSTDMKEKAYEGDILSNFVFLNYPILNGVIQTGELKWENPSYVIKEGNQVVNLSFKPYDKDELIIFNVSIIGIKSNTQNNIHNSKELKCYTDFSNMKIDALTGGKPEDTIPPIYFYNDEGKKVKGTFSYLNWDSSKIGLLNLQWVFTPDDKTYNSQSGEIIINFYSLEDPLPSLTATSLMLDEAATFDININDKIEGSTYQFTSSNTRVAKVSSRSGVVQALSS